MIAWLKGLFAKRPPAPRKGARTYETGGVWGDAINWQERGGPDGVGRVVGWKSCRPERGDVLLTKMQSGKTGKFVFTHVDYQRDPRDMFFADVAFVGYVEDAP